MPRLVKKASKKAGLPPGSLVHIGEKKTESVRITAIEYDETRWQEKEVATIEECFPVKGEPTITWIHIRGVHQIAPIEEIGKRLNLHPLLLEDIVNTEQRPKLEEYGDYIFVNEVIKVLTIITTIFIPMSFIAGVFGMNFKYMPELEWRFGYPLALAIMCAIGVAMLLYFRKKRWL